MKLSKKYKTILLERFLRYVKIETTSDPHKQEIPSTKGQWELLHMLEEELKEAGASGVYLDKHGYLIGHFAAGGSGRKAPVIGLMAHVDTSSDMSGRNVKPQIIEDYDLGEIPLGTSGYSLNPAEHPALLKRKGDTIITSDGTTLLGADDKAGVAEIMTALVWLKDHPEVPRGELEIVFTPDEETGRGLDKFDTRWLNTRCCYTIDGGELGEIETECFNASGFEAVFQGKVIHPGAARGKLINALSMAGTFLGMLPGAESPEATDGRYGYYAPMEIEGNMDKVKVRGIIRDFDRDELERRSRALKAFAKAVEHKYPGGKVALKVKKQYANMYEHIKKDPQVMDILEKAVTRAGVTPVREIIRGGTDGSRLSEMGIPTPNVFTGGHNYHSRFEWVSLGSMVKASEVIINLISLWAVEKR
ncbi:MAG: peptidase T [Spirochaetes bacterium]|nr:MAG: peptidase T [Spirochaetota bacterium]